jgi:hypothetical protein
MRRKPTHMTQWIFKATVAAMMASSGAIVSFIHGDVAAATEKSNAVVLDCSQSGGDQRTAEEASVKPGVIIATTYSFSPTTYTPFTIDDTGHSQVIGPFATIATTDHLVAVWENSTDCSGDEISRNAWVADTIGRVYSDDTVSGPVASNFGDASGIALNKPMVGMSPTSDGNGYWLVAADGGIFTYGDAQFHGSTGSLRLNKPIVGMAVTPDGGGYWLVATDGGVFAFGDAPFYGSTGSLVLNKPIEAILPTQDGQGYWMVASDGGIFCFGDAQFHGSLGGRNLSAPIAGMIPNGNGYTLIGEDGQLYAFS